MSLDDDRFRRAGSPYEHEEPVAVAVVAADARIDWSEAGRSADAALWLPESLFLEVATNTGLRSIRIHGQTRLGVQDCERLCEELGQVVDTSSNPDVRTAAALIQERAQRVIALGQSHVFCWRDRSSCGSVPGPGPSVHSRMR